MFRFRPITILSVAGLLGVAVAAPAMFQEMGLPTPTEEHAMLQKSVGHWEGTVTMTMPGMPESSYAATEDVKSIGPFWVQSDFHSEFMGMGYHGHGTHGFDPEKGEHVSTWVDNMSTYLSVMRGEYDAEKGLLTMKWDAPDMTGAMAAHRSEQKMTEDAYTMTFYTADVKTMVIDMKRKSAKPMEASSER